MSDRGAYTKFSILGQGYIEPAVARPALRASTCTPLLSRTVYAFSCSSCTVSLHTFVHVLFCKINSDINYIVGVIRAVAEFDRDRRLRVMREPVFKLRCSLTFSAG